MKQLKKTKLRVKKYPLIKNKLLALSLLFSLFNFSLYAQEKKSARLSVSYIKDNVEDSYISAKVKFKEDKQYFPAKNLQLSLYKIIKNEDEKIDDVSKKLASVSTNQDGEAIFYLKSHNFNSEEKFFEVKIENDQNYMDKSTEISFKDAEIIASVSQKDSIHTIKINLVDNKKEPIASEYISVKLKRLFGLMNIGSEDLYKTDEDGEVTIEIEDNLYSKNGIIEIVVKLDDSDEYGTIIEHLKADIGVIMESKDSYDERTMWATAAKAPLYILILPNLILVAIWSILVFLIFNLYRIYKHN